MKSLQNPKRFLPSVSRYYGGNRQPTRAEAKRIVAGITAFRRPKRKVRFIKMYVPKSAGWLR